MRHFPQRLITVFLWVFLQAMMGCRPDVINEFRPYPEETTTLAGLLSKVRDTSFQVRIALSGIKSDSVLTCPSGLRIILGDTSGLFEDENGNTIDFNTPQQIFLEVAEIQSKGELFGRSVSTTDVNGYPLDCVRGFHFRVVKGDTPLSLRAGRTIRVQFPDASFRENLIVYVGQETGGSVSGWNNSGAAVIASDWTLGGSGMTVKGYELAIGKLGWVACLEPLLGPLGSFCLTLPQGFTTNNTWAYLAYSEYSTLQPLKAEGEFFCNQQVSAGYPVRLVVVSNYGGQYWYCCRTVETNTQLSVKETPQVIEESELIKLLKEL
jgi:hypothetical protein